MAGIGHWISPNRVDLTNVTIDPFDVIVGTEQDTGSLVIRQRFGHVVTVSFQGIYTCIIPDENGVQTYHHIGIYQHGFNSKNNNDCY